MYLIMENYFIIINIILNFYSFSKRIIENYYYLFININSIIIIIYFIKVNFFIFNKYFDIVQNYYTNIDLLNNY